MITLLPKYNTISTVIFPVSKSSICHPNRDYLSHLAAFNRLHIANQKNSMCIQTVATPSPKSIKFMPGRVVLEAADDSSRVIYVNNTSYYVINYIIF